MYAAASAQEPALFSQDVDPAWLDELITLSKAVKAIPGGRGANSVNPSTAYRWVVDGRLQAVRCGGRLLTTRRWLKEMLIRGMESFVREKGIGMPSTSISSASGDDSPKQLGAMSSDLIDGVKK